MTTWFNHTGYVALPVEDDCNDRTWFQQPAYIADPVTGGNDKTWFNLTGYIARPVERAVPFDDEIIPDPPTDTPLKIVLWETSPHDRLNSPYLQARRKPKLFTEFGLNKTRNSLTMTKQYRLPGR